MIPGEQRILVTGASGFIGSALVPALKAAGYATRCAVRRLPEQRSHDAETAAVGDIDGTTEWAEALRDVETVVHLAARTHVLRETASDPLAAYRRVNVDGTRQLATQAAAAGVRRLVFLSSIKVNGERTFARPYTEDDTPQPEDAYGITKWEAEQALRAIERETGLQVVVLRPPLVYGPGVKGNFLRLMKLVSRGWPLPLASVRNQRSLVYLGNLVEAILACIKTPAAAGRTYLVSDGHDLSTPDLVRALAECLGVPPHLYPFPPSLLMLGASLVGKREEAARVLGSLQVESSRIRKELGWQPPHTMEEGLTETARWFRLVRGLGM
ncbi:MAG TPA: SDR family oxidoreductase [Burkholderiales bacterium]|nr:SDR family oxidoreductase [Burkholderiales bacterium]